MPETVTPHGWWDGIRRRARERDIERQVLYNRTRRATLTAYLAARARGRVPELLPEFLKVLLGSMLAFWLIAAALAYFFDARPLYTYVLLAIVFSVQATWYKRQLAKNPDFRIRRCNCGAGRRDSTENVLKSRASTILGIPNSALATALYGVLLALLYAGHAEAALFVSAAAVLVSAYLAYIMITQVRGLCSTCINIAALNCLMLWQLLP